MLQECLPRATHLVSIVQFGPAYHFHSRCLPQSSVIPSCLPSSQPPYLQVEEEKILLILYAAVVHRPDATLTLEAKARKEHMGPRKTRISPKLNAMHAVGMYP